LSANRNDLGLDPLGARNTHWVSAKIDERDPSLFVFEPRMVAANAT